VNFSANKNGYFHEQRASVKFCFKLGKTFLETFKMLKQTFWDEAMIRTQTHEWYKHFKEGQISISDNEGSGQ
jgi:hypothetical protein